MCKGQEEEEEDEKEKQGQEGKSGRNNTSADESAFFSESNTNTDDAGSGCESGDELPRAPYHANEHTQHTQHTRRSDSKWDSESDSESRWSSDDSASTSEEEYESDESADLQAERALLNLDTTTTTTTSSGSRLDCVQRGHVTTALCL